MGEIHFFGHPQASIPCKQPPQRGQEAADDVDIAVRKGQQSCESHADRELVMHVPYIMGNMLNNKASSLKPTYTYNSMFIKFGHNLVQTFVQ